MCPNDPNGPWRVVADLIDEHRVTLGDEQPAAFLRGTIAGPYGVRA
jgi:hypothetical protein